MVNDNQAISTGKMKMKIMNALLVISLFSTCTSIAANDFKCKVLDSVKLVGNGTLSSSNNVALKEMSKEFTVNRLTGIMSGSGFVNNMGGVAPTVYNYSKSEGNSYSVITIYKPNYTIDHLTIKEWVEGIQKPFFYQGAWGEMASGLCEYY